MIGKSTRRRDERLAPSRVLGYAATLMALTAAAVALAVKAPDGLPGQSHYHLTAEFTDAKGLLRHSEVWIAGRRVGQVVDGASRGDTAVLQLQLDPAVAPLPADTTATIKARSLLGARVVELTPGSSRRSLADGARLAPTQTTSNVELTDVLQRLDRRRRGRLQTGVRQLGVGFLGRGAALNGALADAPTFFEGLRPLASEVIARDGAAARFFPALADAAAAADPVREDIARGFAPEADVVGALADDRARLSQLLDVAAPALRGTRAGLRDAEPLLRATTRLALAADAALANGPRALGRTARLLDAARRPLRRTERLLAAAGAAVPRTLAFLGRIDARIPQLRRGLAAPVAIFDAFGRHRCDVTYWGRNWRSMLGFAPFGGMNAGGDVGPLNTLRVQFESVLTSQPSNSSSPVTYALDPYPAPCTASAQRTR